MLKDYLSPFAVGLAGHAELRAQQNTSRAVAMLNGDLISNARAQQGGVSARVYRNGVYGFASAVEYDEESVRRVLKAAEGDAAEVAVNFGSFVAVVLDFIIIAFAVFCMVKAINKFHKKKEEAPAAPPEPSAEEKLLTEIRDLLKEKN